jgi:transcriptional regulator with XRE-family HTH domain
MDVTKAELARRVGVCASAAVQWEHPYGTAPSVANLARIAEITGVAFEWLATGRGPQRVAAEVGESALDPECLARTLFEEQLLKVARQLPARHHEPLIQFLSTCVKDSRRQQN